MAAQKRALAHDIVQALFIELAPLCNAAAATLAKPANDTAPPTASAILYPPEAVRRFWTSVETNDDGACWIWTGPLVREGYGRFNFGRRHLAAHRFAYEIAVGPIPPGASLLHACDNRRCVNPAHLRAGSRAENVADMVGRRRHRHGETHRNAKLTAAAVRIIRGSDESAPLLAKRFSVSASTVRNIRTGRRWALLDETPPAPGNDEPPHDKGDGA